MVGFEPRGNVTLHTTRRRQSGRRPAQQLRLGRRELLLREHTTVSELPDALKLVGERSRRHPLFDGGRWQRRQRRLKLVKQLAPNVSVVVLLRDGCPRADPRVRRPLPSPSSISPNAGRTRRRAEGGHCIGASGPQSRAWRLGGPRVRLDRALGRVTLCSKGSRWSRSMWER
jgi:hypothetical protein